MKEAKDFFQSTFIGEYRFERTISSPRLTYEGTASFLSLPQGGRAYVEEGIYKRGEDWQEIYQQREFHLGKDGFFILKSDGSILHEFDFSLGEKDVFPFSSDHIHVCKKDLYRCVFSIEGPNRFSTHYTIKGPRKDYEIVTVYERTRS